MPGLSLRFANGYLIRSLYGDDVSHLQRLSSGALRGFMA
jgi:hypothetical protein